MEPGDPPKRRALEALSDAEERHAILAKVHMALARGWRQNELRRLEGREDEARAVREERDQLQEELCQALVITGDAVLADREVLELAMGLPKVQNDSVVMLRALQTLGGDAFQHASPELLADRDTMLKAVGLHGGVLRFASEPLQDDKAVVLAAIQSDPWSLAYASDSLKACREVVVAAIGRQDPTDTTQQGRSVLTLAAPELRDDKEVVLAAIAKKPIALHAVSARLKCDRAVVLDALQKQSIAALPKYMLVKDNVLDCASEALRGDRELALEAVKIEGAAVRLASAELRGDKDFILAATRVAPWHHRIRCYPEASEDVQINCPYTEFQDAVNSVLAVAGETAPVLTISPGPSASQSSGRPTSTPSTCEVTLLTGASFSCSLLRPPSPNIDHELEAPRQPVLKQCRLADVHSESFSLPTAASYLTVGELARQALEEAVNHTQVAPPPKRVFLVFSKPGGISSEPVSATPWDCNRLVTDFL